MDNRRGILPLSRELNFFLVNFGGRIKIIPLPDIIKNCRDIFIDKLEDRFKDSKKKKLLQREKKESVKEL